MNIDGAANLVFLAEQQFSHLIKVCIIASNFITRFSDSIMAVSVKRALALCLTLANAMKECVKGAGEKSGGDWK